MINQVLMALGDSTVRLTDSCPPSIRRVPRLRDHILFTKGHSPDPDLSPAVLKASAIYSMRIDRIEDRTAFSGPSIMAWLGDNDRPGKGYLNTLASGTRTLTQLVDALTWPCNGITKGSPYSSPPITLTDAVFLQTHRDALDRWRLVTGGEYRVNARGSFDWGSADSATLWRFAGAMTLLLMQGATGRDLDGIDGLPVTEFRVSESGADFVSGASVWDLTTPGSASGGFTNEGGFDAGTGASIFAYESVSPGSETDRYNEIQATAVDQETISVEIDPSVPNVLDFFTENQPGDYVYVYDPDTNLVDHGNQVPYRGAPIHPRSDLRVLEMTTPITAGMGVYHYATAYDRATATAGSEEITDLTPYIEWETGGATLVLGKQPQIGLRRLITGR